MAHRSSNGYNERSIFFFLQSWALSPSGYDAYVSSAFSWYVFMAHHTLYHLLNSVPLFKKYTKTMARHASPLFLTTIEGLCYLGTFHQRRNCM